MFLGEHKLNFCGVLYMAGDVNKVACCLCELHAVLRKETKHRNSCRNIFDNLDTHKLLNNDLTKLWETYMRVALILGRCMCEGYGK